MKRIITLALLLVVISTSAAAAATGTKHTKKPLPLRVTAENALSYKAVTSRKNRFTWVEIIQGTCTSKRGDGLTDGGYYINYHRVKGHKPGKRYITICIYANTSYCDDIEHRYDIEM